MMINKKREIMASFKKQGFTGDLSTLNKSDLKRLTTKAQRQEWKAQKKLTRLKTPQERQAEVNDVKRQLEQWNIDMQFEAVRQLYEHLDAFVETGEVASGTIPFPECPPEPIGRNIVYHFNNIKGQKGTCNLIIRDGEEYFKKERGEDAPLEPLEGRGRPF
jgi:hypothetical protein